MLPDSIISYCQQQQVDLTPIRMVLLEHLWHTNKPMKAYTLIDVLREKGIGAPKPPTVYRTLDYLAAANLVHKVHSLNAYVACHHPDTHKGCHLLICTHCDMAKEFCDAQLETLIPYAAHSYAFTPQKIVVEVFGTCKDCSELPPETIPASPFHTC